MDHEQRPQFEKEIKPSDWLPDGTEMEDYIKEDKEWGGGSLEKRIGQPRILDNVYFPEVADWVEREFAENPEDFSYFEAGVGHGNDLRAIKKALDNKGRFLGVDVSKAEITHGLDFYQKNQGENIEEARQLFAVGNLQNLDEVRTWDDEARDFSKPTKLQEGQFDLLYMEAVMHGFGYGKKTYQEKKAVAQQVLNNLFKICKNGGKFFGRASMFGPNIDKEGQFALMRETNNWRFVPESEEFVEMLEDAGFKNIKTATEPHPRAGIDREKKDILRLAFLAEK